MYGSLSTASTSGLPHSRSGRSSACGLLGRPDVDDHEADHRLPGDLGREQRLGRAHDHQHRADRLGRVVHVVAPVADDLVGVVGRVNHHPRGNVGPEWLQIELERGHDQEVRAGAADTPEQLGLLLGACPDDPAVRGDARDRNEAVHRDAVTAHDPADSAPEREPGHPGVRHRSAGDPERVRLRLAIDDPPLRSTADDGAPTGRIDMYAVHQADVDPECAVDEALAACIVAAATDADGEIVLAREAKRRNSRQHSPCTSRSPAAGGRTSSSTGAVRRPSPPRRARQGARRARLSGSRSGGWG